MDGYQVKSESSTTYSIKAVCDGGTIQSIGKDSISLPNAAAISSFGTIIFNALGRGTNLSSDLTVTVGGAGGNQTILVTTGGTVRDN